ncbi:hypothetical protein JHK85_001585 [Glycine max]|nr:hypothetical protein JHK85_001585 [Glycine max]
MAGHSTSSTAHNGRCRESEVSTNFQGFELTLSLGLPHLLCISNDGREPHGFLSFNSLCPHCIPTLIHTQNALEKTLFRNPHLLGRERAIVINLEHIKAIITAQEFLLLNSHDPSVTPSLHELQARIIRHHNQDDVDPNPNPNDAIKILSFEFVSLEACLEAACSVLENEAKTLEQEAHPALDKLTSKISTLNLERVCQTKSRLDAIIGRVQKVKDELEHLLDDDEDMAEMNAPELSFDNVLGRDNHGTRDNATYSAITKQLDVEELEMLLEAYFVQIDGTLNKLSTLGVGGFNMGTATGLYSVSCFTAGKYGNGNSYSANLSSAIGLSGYLPCSNLNSGAIAGGVMHRRQTRTSSRGDENFPRKWAECDMGRDIYHWEHGIKCPTYFRASLQRLSKASTVFDPQLPHSQLLAQGNKILTLEAARKSLFPPKLNDDVSAAIFAPGWVYETKQAPDFETAQNWYCPLPHAHLGEKATCLSWPEQTSLYHHEYKQQNQTNDSHQRKLHQLCTLGPLLEELAKTFDVLVMETPSISMEQGYAHGWLIDYTNELKHSASVMEAPPINDTNTLNLR